MRKTQTFWSTVPWRSTIIFMTGVFLLFSTIGFANDIMEMGRKQSFGFALNILLPGAFAVLYAVAGFSLGKSSWKAFVPIFLVQFVVMGFLANRFPDLPQPSAAGPGYLHRLHDRLFLDALATVIAVGFGYACFVYVSIGEGRRYARVYAEMTLAAEIHRVLVPPINQQIGEFEFCGRSMPSGEVGGDLIDVFQHGREWIAYIADVSGHGVAPGVVMGMVKSAARMQLSSPETTTALLARLNAVLHPIKKAEMFVTFAYLAWNGERLEYASAGHPPILHYHAATNEVTELSCSNFPVGMFPGQDFTAGSVQCAPGDLFLMVTDGLLELTNARGEEFGLPPLKLALSADPSCELPAKLQSLVDAAHRHGNAADDLSLLLVRHRNAQPTAQPL